jgi:hypothetical protein
MRRGKGYGGAGWNRNADGDVRGLSVGLGGRAAGPGGRLDIGGSAHVGGWRGADGKSNYGVGADAQLFKLGIEPGNDLGPFGMDFGALSGNAGCSVNDSTAQMGWQGNLVEGALSLGRSDKNSAGDRYVRGGASFGAGGALRGHYGDADKDGRPEYGFGFDYGPVSFDYKSESLLGDVLTGAACPWLIPVNMGMSALGAGDYAPGTLTQNSINKLTDLGPRGAVNYLVDGGISLLNDAVDAGGGVVNKVVDGGASVINKVIDGGGSAVKKVVDGVGSAASTVVDGAGSVVNKVVDGGASVVNYVSERGVGGMVEDLGSLLGLGD